MSVIIVGAGPTGLALAGDLAAAGVPVKILERRAEESNLTRAFAVHARTLELLDMRGLADGLVAQGIQVPQVRVHLKGAELAFNMCHPDSRFPYVLILRQARTEAALEERARDLGVEIVRGAEVTGLAQDADGVTLALCTGGSERADYVVGCDGAHSAVRRLLGVGFSGKSYDTRILLADVLLKRQLPLAVNPFIGDDGAVLLPPYGDGWFRATIWDRTGQNIPIDQPVDIEEVRDSLLRIAGDDLGLAEMSWSTRFLSERRQARTYRVGRVFLAGDAAHVHSPLGAMGMSTGIQDAANLSWKLAAAHQGWAPPWLLDTYQSERHPVGRTVLRLTDLLRRLADAPAPIRLLRPYIAPAIINHPKISEKARLTLSGLGIHYPTPDGTLASPMAGHRLPDLRLGTGRLYERMRGRFVLLDATTTHEAAGPWHDRIDVLTADSPIPYGEATTLLIRPDGYLAWTATHPNLQQMRLALRQWCGQA
ncbi:FAD-dependent oxidoreductase [Nonomuraea turcica]|uniref:FAD-dependent oxidoreductase n=1 Tax=Nonomuraea sp. G32 TaxID=3067274 RepID=UPI00273A8B6C|nr:FAD-dependent oxidoreductase [Nonomuraea sp. G32]MDP4505338.1 FAD-dependent monooxygenase [Nonomuraea sp. G32]